MTDAVVSRRALYGVGGALILLGLGVAAVGFRSPKVTDRVGPYRPRMIIVPGGRFTMGSLESERGRDSDEAQKEVDVTSFAIAETEVTQGQWEALMGSNPSYFTGERAGGSDHPVERVSWYDAIVYLNALSRSEQLTPCYNLARCSGEVGSGCPSRNRVCDGTFVCEGGLREVIAGCSGYRLPTEAEWEYAARADEVGSVPGGDLANVAWFSGNSESGTRAVGTRRPNAWNLADALGNVWEWTATPEGGQAVLRGCSWFNDAAFCRAAERFHFAPGIRFRLVGFRPARSIPHPSKP